MQTPTQPLGSTLSMTQEQLEWLCSEELVRAEIKSLTRAPWLDDSAESYSFGKCYREVAKFPSALPLAVSSDNGVYLRESRVTGQKSWARTHLVWSEWRANISEPNLKIHRTIHPFVGYRRLKSLNKNEDAVGTLVFLPHSNPTIDYLRDGWNRLIADAKALPEEFQPVVFCLHMHDVRKRKHLPLLSNRLRVITFGEVRSPLFVDRFYDGLLSFKYSASNAVGSHSFLSEEAGVGFFLIGEEPEISQEAVATFRRVSLARHLKESLQEEAHRKQHIRQVFSEFPPTRSMEKDRLIVQTLGLEVSVDSAGRALRGVLWRELISNWFRITIKLSKLAWFRFLEFARLRPIRAKPD